MTKKVLLVFLLISVHYILQSQEYFNYRFDYTCPGVSDGASNVFVTTDGYIIGGTTGTAANNSRPRAGFFKTDFSGNKIFSKFIGDTVSDYYLGEPGSIIRVNDTLIVASGFRVTPTADFHEEGMLYFLDNDFDTLCVRNFSEKSLPFDTSIIFYQVKKTNQDDLIVTGIKRKNGTPDKILLIKTDYLGNLVWEKTYGGGGDYFEGYSVICTSDGGYAIGGYNWHLRPSPNLTGDPVVYKTDSTGNFKWSYNYGTPFIDTRGMLCSTIDGNMILGFAYCDSMHGGGPSTEGNPFRRINLIKIDNGGNTIWNKKYGASEENMDFSNIRENPDGTLIATGTILQFFPTSYRQVGWILKTTSEGDSLWYRQYDVCDGEATWHWLYDVIETPDKGYLACGMVFPEPPDTGSNDGWILKVDSMGCESPDYCWVGIKSESVVYQNTVLEISPNPAGSEAVITIRSNGYISYLKIYIYDLFGREAKVLDLLPGQYSISIDVSGLPDGLYMTVVRSGNRIVAAQKIVKM